MENFAHTTITTPIGYLKLVADDNYLVAVSFEENIEPSTQLTEILKKAEKQLQEYFAGTRKVFELQLKPEGSVFQKGVWTEVSKVAFGNTQSYLEIAKRTGSEKNTRAVGLANGKNPIPILIPCHRIIGSNGKLTGYAGGLERKKWLLQHELKHSETKSRLF